MPEDKRKHNGGHSTKPQSLKDKRLNPFRTVLKEAATPEEVKEVIRAVYEKAKEGDTKAATLFLSYYLGKPKESIELSASGDIQFTLKKLVSFNSDNIEEAEEID